LEFKTTTLPHSTVYTLTIPPEGHYVVKSAIAETVGSLETFAQQHQAIAVINGGFFDPVNQKSTSHVQVNRQQVADPAWNERLTQNPNLSPYLDQIRDRSEWRRYLCGATQVYEIVAHHAPASTGCQLVDVLGAGPQLLPTLTAEAEAFLKLENGEVIRDPIGLSQRNARSAVGLTADGSLVLVMVAQQSDQPNNSGMSIAELIAHLRTLNVTQALNLDGGSSSALYYLGKTRYGKVDETGQPVQRPVKSVLMVVPKTGERS
jgi:exopolysaccharide biosynthesis protein